MARRPAFQPAGSSSAQSTGVVYNDWCAEDWLPGRGRRCRHLPSDCVFDVTWRGLEPHAELRTGSCEPQLRKIAEKFFLLFASVDPDH